MIRREGTEPPSDFVKAMTAAMEMRWRAETAAEKRSADENMADIMRCYLGGRKVREAAMDRKLAAAGKDAE